MLQDPPWFREYSSSTTKDRPFLRKLVSHSDSGGKVSVGGRELPSGPVSTTWIRIFRNFPERSQLRIQSRPLAEAPSICVDTFVIPGEAWCISSQSLASFKVAISASTLLDTIVASTRF